MKDEKHYDGWNNGYETKEFKRELIEDIKQWKESGMTREQIESMTAYDIISQIVGKSINFVVLLTIFLNILKFCPKTISFTGYMVRRIFSASFMLWDSLFSNTYFVFIFPKRTFFSFNK